jgi:hypothetical protein
MYAESATDQAVSDSGNIANILERMRREPALRGRALMAPTRTLAALGVSLDDARLVQLLEHIAAMDARQVT